MTIINDTFPVVHKTIRQKTLNNKWLTDPLLSEIKTKNKLFAKKLKYPNENNIDKYRAQLKHVEKLKKQTKRKYFQNQLETYSTNIKKKWDLLREIILKKRKINNIPLINHENTLVTDKTKISEIFADYFQTIGSSLSSKFEGISQRRFQRWLYRSPRPPENFILTEFTPNEIEKCISDLDTSKGAGIDEISPKLVKEGINELTLHLTNIFNISVMSGIFPQCHKLARCVPIFKRHGESSLVTNYRPIAIITCVGKLLEKLVASYFKEYLEKNTIICDNQH